MEDNFDKPLKESFIDELFHVAMTNTNVYNIVRQHVKYEYLPNEHYKLILQQMGHVYVRTAKCPSFATLYQHFDEIDNKTVEPFIEKVRNARCENVEDLLNQLEIYIKKSRFVLLYNSLGEEWQSGNHLKAMEILESQTKTINSFSVKTTSFVRVFQDWSQRQETREVERLSYQAAPIIVPFSIDCLDDLCFGGMGAGEIALFTAQSGVGKTKCLRWIAANGARRGFKIFHISAEGSKKECEIGFDATWTAINHRSLLHEDLNDALKKKLNKIAGDISQNGGEVFIDAYEEFGSAKMSNVRKSIEDLIALVGPIDLITLDYFEKFEPTSNYRYKPSEERERRMLLADELKNIAMEFNTRIITATQASTIDVKDWNNPNFVMTRYNISEFKALVNPFSFHFTLNQTNDEKESNFMRIYVDKLRNYKAQQTVGIYQRYDRDKFYDRKRSVELQLGVKASLPEKL